MIGWILLAAGVVYLAIGLIIEMIIARLLTCLSLRDRLAIALLWLPLRAGGMFFA
jgi:hypothetical protein